MCNANDNVVGAVLGQQVDKKFHVIYYESRNLYGAYINYATIGKKLLFVGFTIDKFHSYLVGGKIIVYADHASIM